MMRHRLIGQYLMCCGLLIASASPLRGAQFWLSTSADATPSHAGSPPPQVSGAVPNLTFAPGTKGGSLFIWAKLDDDQILENWSLRAVSTNYLALDFIGGDIASFNPRLGTIAGPGGPIGVYRWEEVGEPVNNRDSANRSVSTLDNLRGFSTFYGNRLPVGIGPPGGGAYSDPFYHPGTKAWLLGRIDFTLGTGASDVYLQIGQAGMNYLNGTAKSINVILGEDEHLTVPFNADDNTLKSSTTAEAIVKVTAENRGDFDGDGDADGMDFLAWQQGVGSPNATHAKGNANSDQVIDSADLAIWGGIVPSISADFDYDGDVDGSDLLVWQRGVGTLNALRKDGDANGDGAVNAADLAVWRQQLVGASMSSSDSTGTGVPEPMGAALTIIAAGGFALFRQGRRPRKTPPIATPFAAICRLGARLVGVSFFKGKSVLRSRSTAALVFAATTFGANIGTPVRATIWWDGGGGSNDGWGVAANWGTDHDVQTAPNPLSIDTNTLMFSLDGLNDSDDFHNTYLNGRREPRGIHFRGSATVQIGTAAPGFSGTTGPLSPGVDGMIIDTSANVVINANVEIRSNSNNANTQIWTNTNGTMTIDGSTDLNGYSLSVIGGGVTTFNGNITNSNGNLAVNATSVVINGAANQNGSISINGGTLTLNHSNGYKLGTFINGGTLIANDDNNLGLAGNGVQLSAATLRLANGFSSSRPMSIISLFGLVEVQGSGSATWNGPINGAGALTKTGNGTLTLGGSNSHTLGTAISAGTLVVSSGANLGSGGLYFKGGTLRTTAGINFGQYVFMETPGTVETNGTTSTFTGGITGAGSLTITGGGALNFSGPSSATGETFVNGSTLIAMPGSIPSGAVRITSGAYGLTSSDGTYSNTIVLNGAGATFDTGAGNDTISGQIQGTSISLIKAGAATLTLTANNIYGPTTVNGGTLQIGDGGATGSLGTGSTTLAAGTTLAFNRSNDYTYSPVISGGGSVSKTGDGTLVLSGSPNSYTGKTTVNGGTLQLSKTSAGASDKFGAAVGDLDINNNALVQIVNTWQIRDDATVNVNGSRLDVGNGAQELAQTLNLNSGTLQGLGGWFATPIYGNTINSTGSSTISAAYLALGAQTPITVAAGGTLTIQSEVRDYGSGGGLKKEGAGTLTLSGSVANTATGTTTVNGGTLKLSRSAFDGAVGQLTVNSGARLQYGNHHQVKDASTVTVNGGTIDFATYSDAFDGLVLNNGYVSGGAGSVVSIASGGVTSTGNSTIDTQYFGLFGGNHVNVTSGTLAIASIVVDTPNASTLIKKGPGTLVLNGGAINAHTGGTIVDQGTLVLDRGVDGSLYDYGVAVGNLTISTGATVRVQQYSQIKNSAAVVINGGTLDFTGPYIDSVGSLTINNGQVTGAGGIGFTSTNAITSTGTSSISSLRVIPQVASGDFRVNVADGVLNIPNGLEGTSPNQQLHKLGAGELRLGGISTHNGGNLIDAGRLVVNGSITGPVVVNPGSSLGGSGTVNGLTTNHGRVAPGNSPGILNINGNYTQGADGTLEIEVGGLTPGNNSNNHDQLAITGSAALAGRIEVPLYNGFVPVAGNTIRFLTAAGGISGTLQAPVSGNLPTHLAMELAYVPGAPATPTAIDLHFVPSLTNILYDHHDVTAAPWEVDATWLNTATPGIDEIPKPQNNISVSTLIAGDQTVVVDASNADINYLQVGKVANDNNRLNVRVDANGTLHSTIAVQVIDNGSVTLNSGTISTAAVHVESGGTLQGSGSVLGNVVVGVDINATAGPALLSPGNSPGTLSISQDLVQGDNSKTLIEIQDGTTFDKIHVGKTATVDGVLAISVAPNAVIAPGTKFEIVTAGELGPGSQYDRVATTTVGKYGFEVTYQPADSSNPNLLVPGGKVYLEAVEMGDFDGVNGFNPEKTSDAFKADLVAMAVAFINPKRHDLEYPQATDMVSRGDFYPSTAPNGRFNFDDLVQFRKKYSITPPEWIAAMAAAGKSVPEPTAAALAVLAACGAHFWRTPRRRGAPPHRSDVRPS
jgi:autotransporter-associated beta strand protein